MNNGWILGGDHETMWLTKGERTVTFDIKIPTPKGTLYAMYFKRESKPEIAAVGIQGAIKVNYQEMHDKLGHCNEDMTRKAAKLLGFEWKEQGTRGSKVSVVERSILNSYIA
jgi:hypothetical protein